MVENLFLFIIKSFFIRHIALQKSTKFDVPHRFLDYFQTTNELKIYICKRKEKKKLLQSYTPSQA